MINDAILKREGKIATGCTRLVTDGSELEKYASVPYRCRRQGLYLKNSAPDRRAMIQRPLRIIRTAEASQRIIDRQADDPGSGLTPRERARERLLTALADEELILIAYDPKVRPEPWTVPKMDVPDYRQSLRMIRLRCKASKDIQEVWRASDRYFDADRFDVWLAGAFPAKGSHPAASKTTQQPSHHKIRDDAADWLREKVVEWRDNGGARLKRKEVEVALREKFGMKSPSARQVWTDVAPPDWLKRGRHRKESLGGGAGTQRSG